MSAMDYNVEAEQSVIGSILIDSRCVGSVLSELSHDDFSQINRTLIGAIGDLFRANARIDAVTVIGAAVKRGADREEMRSYVLQIVEITPTAANVAEYIRLVREATRVRKMHEVAEMMLAARSSDAIAKAMEHMAEAMAESSQERVKTSTQLSMELLRWLDDPTPTKFLPTTIPQLDRQLMLEKGMYTVIGGFPSDGKTMLALQIGMELAKTMRVGLFFYEGNTLQAARRMYSTFSGISFSALRRRSLTEQAYGDLAVASAAFNSLQFEAIQATGFRASDIRAMTAARKYDVVIIDYLQLIEPANWKDDDTRAVSHASKAIRAMTIDLNVLTIALSQFHRLGNGVRRAPTMADLRQSGQIEQDANVILLLSDAGVEPWEKEDNYNADNVPENARGRLLQIAKNREGVRDGWMHMLMYGDLQRFVYYDPSRPWDYLPVEPEGELAEQPEPEYEQTMVDLGYGDFPKGR